MQRTISGNVINFNNLNILDTFKVSQSVFFAFNVKNPIIVTNPQVTKVHSIRVGTSETIRLPLENDWCDWLAGLIDGDGCFLLSKKGYASLEITMDMKDAHCLYQIKQVFGGSIKRRCGVKAMRYRLHHLKGMLFIISSLNGRIRNPKRQIQFSKICIKYKIAFVLPPNLLKNNGWFSGFFDSDGTVVINKSNKQLSISIFQKTSELLFPLKFLYGGNVYIDHGNYGGFKWYISSKQDILNIIEYFKLYPSRAFSKNKRLHLIPDFFHIKSLIIDPVEKDKLWDYFFLKWFDLSDEDIVR